MKTSKIKSETDGTAGQRPSGSVPRNVSGSVWVTIRDNSGHEHGPMRVCWVINWEDSSPVEKVLWVHRHCGKATGGKPFEFVRVEYREDPPPEEDYADLAAYPAYPLDELDYDT